MIVINFSNIEELIFHDRNIQSLLSKHLFSYFEQWRLSKRFPVIKSIGKQAVLDVLNQLNESDIFALEQHFGKNIVVEKLDYSVVKNIKVPLNEADICCELCKQAGFNYFSSWRDGEYLYLSLWR